MNFLNFTKPIHRIWIFLNKMLTKVLNPNIFLDLTITVKTSTVKDIMGCKFDFFNTNDNIYFWVHSGG